MKFKTFLENIYGFKEPEIKKPKEDNLLPIKSFNIEQVVNELHDYKLEGYENIEKFFNEMQWGNEVGAIKAAVTPNIGVVVSRYVTDNNGDLFWAVKRLMSINTDYAGEEPTVARDIFEHVKEISEENIQHTKKEYKIFELTKKIVNEIKNVNNFFHFNNIIKMSENNYNIMLNISHAGVGDLVGRLYGGLSPYAIIDMSFNEQSGRIKGILTSIAIDNDSGTWEVDVPYFMGEFSSSQDDDEIIRVMKCAIRHI